MGDQLPEVYWYAFWAAVAIGLMAFGFFQVALKHRRNIKALDVLKTYAEKGGEPPPAIVDELTKQILDSKGVASASANEASPQRRRDELLGLFIGFVFMASLAAGLRAWLVDTNGATWAIHASSAARAFFGFGAFGLLLATLVTRKS
ncbi:MAG TPA: hypothetical protein VKA43_15290 [Gammaproteobacteria bacterium]|nr:hypothetical protein [Gammaproteobacteria bacterium]